MGVFDALGDRGHEEVVFGSDPVSGLKSIIAIHSTALGPALGGTRFYPYGSEDEALNDVLRLSAAMSLKAAAAGLDLGGGKSVIIGDPRKDKSERLWRAYGRVVDSLQGRYITAEDVGTDANDMELIRRETRWVFGVPVEEGGSGDPSPATARGLMAATRAVMKFMDKEDLAGRHAAVLGVGKVGSDLVRRYIEAGAKVTIADVYPPAIDALVKRFPAVQVVSPEDIYEVECDVFAPSSLGGVLNAETIPRLRCKAIVGSANNQLAEPEDADRLNDRSILYGPDFVVNAGGLINVSQELGGYTIDKAAARIDKIYDNTLRILETSRERGVTPNQAAIDLAQERISEIGNLRLFRRSGDDRN